MFRSALTAITALVLTATFMQAATFANENVYDNLVHSTAMIDAGNCTGTGVLVDAEAGLLVTNYHVISEAVTVKVYFPEFNNGRAVGEKEFYRNNPRNSGINATVVASDKSRDIAILKIDAVPENIVAIEFGEPTHPGQNVHSIGNPDASDAMWIYTYGKVRQNYYRETKFDFGITQMQVVETDSPINPGDSGGPIVNDDGKLVGICQGHSTDTRMYSWGVDITEITWYINKFKRSTAEAVITAEAETNSPNVYELADFVRGEHGTVRGMFVGISAYGAGNSLQFCEDDAFAVAEACQKNLGLLSANTNIISDPSATRDHFLSALRDAAEATEKDDLLVFFYSGHGDQKESETGPNAADPDGKDEMIVLVDGTVLDDEFADIIATAKGHVIIVMDSCFSGGFAKDVCCQPNRLGLFSSEGDCVSIVADEFRRGGYLSHFFIQSLTQQVDVDLNNDHFVTVHELCYSIQQQYRDTIGSQWAVVPESDGSLPRGVLYPTQGSYGFQQAIVDRDGVNPHAIVMTIE